MSKNDITAGALVVARSALVGGRLDVKGGAAVTGNLKVSGWLDAPNLRGMCVGLFSDEEALVSVYPRPRDGMYALVGDSIPAAVWVAYKGEWSATGGTGGDSTVDFAEYDTYKAIVDAWQTSNVQRISVDDFNAFPADTSAIKASWEYPSRWQITLSDTYVIGICDVFYDASAHTIVEILTTEHTISDEELQGSSHVDGLVCTYMRVYKTSSSSTLSNDAQTWTSWKIVSAVDLRPSDDDTDDDTDDDSDTTTVDSSTLLNLINSLAVLTTAVETLQATVDEITAISDEDIEALCTFDDDDEEEGE